MFLAKMTTEQAAQAFRLDPVILLPVGSCEQHGPQCALGTDFLIPDHLARQVEALPNLIVAPTVPYGVCPYHMSFAGSIDIGYEGLHHLLHSITFSLMQHGARRFLILNGHGGNNPCHRQNRAGNLPRRRRLCQHRLVESGRAAGPIAQGRSRRHPGNLCYDGGGPAGGAVAAVPADEQPCAFCQHRLCLHPDDFLPRRLGAFAARHLRKCAQRMVWSPRPS